MTLLTGQTFSRPRSYEPTPRSSAGPSKPRTTII